MRVLAGVMAAGLLAGAPAMADECANAQTQTDLNICAYKDFQAADAALNKAYAKLMAQISAPGQASLRKAEKSWLAYRDNECSFETLGTADGSINPMMVSQCQTELTEAQTKRLQAQLNCQEGDPSCGGQ